MTPMGIFGLGPTELIIILIVVLLLFGGTRLAGLGKSSGKAIREFKEETRAIKDDEARARDRHTGPGAAAVEGQPTAPRADVPEAEIIDDKPRSV